VDAIADDVEAVLGRTGVPVPPLRVSITGSGPPSQLVADQIVLHPDLLGPDLLAGPDRHRPPALALDRFRRATGLVVEGALVHASAQATDLPVEAIRDAWWAVGPAAEAVDRAAPALGWLWPSLADLLAHPTTSMAAHPRRAAWWFRYLDGAGGRPDDPSQVPAPAWAAFGAWLRDRARGPLATCPLPMDLASACAPGDAPETLASLSHLPLLLPGGSQGARWSAGGGHLHGDVAAPAGGAARAVLGAVAPAAPGLQAQPPGPVGTWALASGHFGARVGAARGVELRLADDGTAELTGADAFVGPPTRELLAMAEQFGVSGSATGTWRLLGVDGSGAGGRLAVRGLDGDAAVHPRKGGGFALPAGDWLQPVKAVLAMLDDRPVAWSLGPAGQRLTMRVDLSGTEMAFAFDRVAGA
jgi:hypothetical protein